MGLDQWAAIRTEDWNINGDFWDEIDRWREDWTLQRWMERLYQGEEGGRNELYNVQLNLTLEDIDKLEADMPNLKGFCAKATEALKEDKEVFYQSNW